MQDISILNYDNYREFLRAKLEEKARKNPAFSLRAFARLARMSPSHLSRTLNGQKKLSADCAHQISVALNHSADESAHFNSLVALDKARDDHERGQIMKRMAKPGKPGSKVLSMEVFKVIADWYHFAILNLTNTRGFQLQPRWVAKRLGIKPLEAKYALERLIQLGLIKKFGQNYRADEDAQLQTTREITSTAVQENHRQQLGKAAEALNEIPIELREFNNLTLAMNITDVPKAKRLLREFFDKFEEEMEVKPATEVFQLNMQFYLLSRSDKGDQ